MEKKNCAFCNFCEISDIDFPFCYLKDLYTRVDLGQECDEKDSKGNLMFNKRNTVKQKN